MTTVRWRTLLGLVGVVGMLGTPSAHAGENAAHSIADKFAHDTDSVPAAGEADRQALERKLQEEDRLKADEADMLARAKAEADDRKGGQDRAASQRAAEETRAAEARRLADEKRLADERRIADEKRMAGEKAAQQRAVKEAAERAAHDADVKRLAAEKADADRLAAENEKRIAEDRRLAQEKRLADEQRLAQEKRLAEEKRIAEAKKAEEDLAEDKAARERATREAARIRESETQRLAAEKADAERRETEAAKARIETARQADTQRRMEAERDDEARRLSEKLARARELRAAKELGAGYSALGNPPQPQPSSEEPATAPSAQPQVTEAVPQPVPALPAGSGIALAGKSETRATILLVMEPGTRGIRRYEKTGDPIICIGEQCYVGSGVDEAAKAMTRGRAFGPGNTLGQRAGACRHSLVCVFRDVEVGAGPFQIQPIDMRILRHDRRETKSVEVDRTCTAAADYLRCSKGLQSATYRVWVVPESVAHKAGAAALSAALSSGLTATAAAELQR